ncbi:DUF1801 domain-containing protein [Patescibacteria group bacterium]|nr:MAG: DUF1801 domain-containing protein [Patescibacteria group bacterium]
MTIRSDDKKAEDEAAVLAAIATMPDKDQLISKRLHAIITSSAPELLPRTWYGMPAYHNGSRIVCWFRSGKKFGERYMTLGFNDTAQLDEGGMWPVNFAITELTDEAADTVATLIKKATRKP